MAKAPKFVISAASAMGFSVLSQALAFFRQILIAAYFGITRELDVYVVGYALATMIVFSFAITFDTGVVPRLVQARMDKGEGASSALANAMFRWSCVLGAAASLLLIAVTPLLMPLVATGFDAGHRSELLHLIVYFAPWTFLCLPYYAAAARHKSQRAFNRVFGAELAIGVGSIACLAAFHDDIRFLPLAYGVGYAIGLALLLPGTGLLMKKAASNAEAKPVLRGVGELYLANQTGTLAGLADRHFQSLAPAGGIAAINYATQLITGIAGLLTFREIYIVPLSESDRRDEKLERLIIGLLMLSVPVVGLIVCFAHEIVYVLFQRGRFDEHATAVTASVLQVYALTLIPGAITTPLARMLQLVERTRLIHVVYLASAGGIVLFGFLFVVGLGLGAVGVAWTLVSAAAVTCGVTARLVARCGLHLNWRRVGRYLAYAIVVTGVAYAVAEVLSLAVAGVWPTLLLGGFGYAGVICATYFAVRRRLRTISG